MPRPYCSVCSRPKVSCICHLACFIQNDIDVVILQHPSEKGKTKGTVELLNQSLASCHVFIGENFENDINFRKIIEKYQSNIALLYPSENATVINKNNVEYMQKDNKIRCIILLDGTWKKAFRLYMMNQYLHYIPHLILPEGITCRYTIRSTQKKGALSTLEACSHALAILENDDSRYESLLMNFDLFNQMYLSFNPENKNL